MYLVSMVVFWQGDWQDGVEAVEIGRFCSFCTVEKEFRS